MNIKQLQIAIRMNRYILSCLYEQKTTLKQYKRYFDEIEAQSDEYECHNKLKKISKEIAGLVDLQKALKRDLADTIIVARIDRWTNSAEGLAWLKAKGEAERDILLMVDPK